MVSIICILGQNRAIGRGNKLIWDIPADLAHFRRVTSGHPVIMGRKTFESIGRPLPNRTNIIVTRSEDFKVEGCRVAKDLESAIEEAKNIDPQEVFVIGGGEIYRQALPFSDKLYLTIVEDSPTDADTFFPEYPEFTKVLSEEEHEHEGLKYKFIELEKDGQADQ